MRSAACATSALVISGGVAEEASAAKSNPTRALPFGREEWTSVLNATKGSLGIRLTGLHFPGKAELASQKKKSKNPFFTPPQYEVVVISSVDPSGQGVKQDKRLRPGLVVKAVQGRDLSGLKAKVAIKQLETEIIARSDGVAMQEEGLSELVEITFSSECVALPEEPNYCYNSVMDETSVLGLTDENGNTPQEAIDFLRTMPENASGQCPRTSWQTWAACQAEQKAKLEKGPDSEKKLMPSSGLIIASPEE